ncbi:anti-sigma factor [Acrocarpospora catenulata]|uniref:anti-sigma factor n=1 Tax=Acrocarpospora catenulata TaxID=2836182 RepID=UPI001BDAEE94|nr:anti-sigma factor [Acrocarpospora catenulata]
MNDDLHTLLGAYVLNALPDEEQGVFEEHLMRCEACAGEVLGLRETAGALAAGVAERPPPRLRPRVLTEIAQVRQLPPEPVRAEPTPYQLAKSRARERARTRVRWRGRIAVGLVAVSVAAAVSAGVLAVTTVRQRDRTLAETTGLLAAPDVVVRRVPLTGGGSATVVASAGQGRLLFASDLPALPAGRTYQMWLIGPGGTRSAGLVDGGGVRTATVPVSGGARRFGLTVEPAGGSEQPTSTPILLTRLA